eukprot:GILJ01013092.1.p1 GENE.GILJ01013092.1~~GILJ01013092.1.p1  ORF type:complete len:1832 (-),score=214.16 GILJ01013092.1:109-5445(-)
MAATRERGNGSGRGRGTHEERGRGGGRGRGRGGAGSKPQPLDLQLLSNMETSIHTVVDVLQNTPRLQSHLNNKFSGLEDAAAFVNILNRICNSPLVDAHATVILGVALQTAFPQKLNNLLSLTMQEHIVFVEHVIELYESALRRSPSLLPFINIEPLEWAVKRLRVDNLKLRFEHLQAFKKDLTDTPIDELNKVLKRQAEAPPASRGGPNQTAVPVVALDSVEDIPVHPTMEDLTGERKPYLSKLQAEYTDPTQYIDNQFRLLREDFVAPLRQAFQSVQSGDYSRSNDVRLYYNAQLEDLVVTQSGMVWKMNFNVKRLGKVTWSRSKRLMVGSLLCLSSDSFTTVRFATVARRDPDLLPKGRIFIEFVETGEPLNYSQLVAEEFTLIESSAYFEAYKHVLTRLKELRTQALPFEDYLIRNIVQVKHPKYLQEKRLIRYDLNSISTGAGYNNCFDITRPWPKVATSMDDWQLEALKNQLTRELALTQGPPGTGKTYIGLQTVRLLLNNRNMWTAGRDSPILIVCYTNHALDQFLSGILKFETNITRVGGNCKDETLQQYNLFDKCKAIRRGKFFYDTLTELRKVKERLERSIEVLKNAQFSVVPLWIVHELDREFAETIEEGILLQYPDLNLESVEEDKNRRSWLCMEIWLGVVTVERVEVTLENQVNRFGLLDEADSDEELANAMETLDVAQTVDPLDETGEIQEEELNEIQNERARDDDKDIDQYLMRQQAQEKAQHKVRNTLLKAGVEIKRGKKSNQFTSRQSRLEPLTEAEMLRRDPTEVWNMNLQERWRMHNYWAGRSRQQLQQRVQDYADSYKNLAKALQETNQLQQLEVLSQSRIVGMTTTGAAKQHRLLRELRPKIVIVEEAAEVLESHIITTLTAHTEQLILIGDHQQLRPATNVYELNKKYNFDVSLFERLIQKGIEYKQLKTQRRMRPEIARMMEPIYADLQNHESVSQYDNIKGISSNIFFLTHDRLESSEGENRSKFNRHEAQFVCGLYRYLVQQGYKPEEITILTTYTGQIFQLRTCLTAAKLPVVRVTSVDNYQGEENEIILLSLVRSNKDSNVGFLKVSNRVCVALSRARKGFYALGNMDCLSEVSPLWVQIKQRLSEMGCIGPQLELRCQNHPATATIIQAPTDFARVPEGGCQQKCGTRLQCGHSCDRMCHPSSHDDMKCTKACARVFEACGHRCTKKCYQECGECRTQVRRQLPCGHEQDAACYLPLQEIECRHKCGRILSCGHQCQQLCSKPCSASDCRVKVNKTLPCGHTVRLPCGAPALVTKCTVACNAKLDCGHECKGTCGSCLGGAFHQNCQHKCERTLVCSHTCPEPCTKNCPPCTKQCENRCHHSRCDQLCGAPCKPCAEPCIWRCPHQRCEQLCRDLCKRPRCDVPCQQRLPCGHPCVGLCGEMCPTLCRICDREQLTEIFFGEEDEQDARFIMLSDCRHIFEVKGLDHWVDSASDSNASIQLKACPKCKVPIRTSLRYGNMVKTFLRDIENVKRVIEEQERDYKQTQNRLKEELKILISQKSIKSSHRIQLMWKLEKRRTMDELITVENQIRLLPLMVDTNKALADFISLSQVSMVESPVESPLRLLAERYEQTLMPAEGSPSIQQLTRVRLGLKTLLVYLDIKRLERKIRKRQPSDTTDLKTLCILESRIEQTSYLLDDSARIELSAKLQELQKRYDEKITKEEMDEVRQAMGQQMNGHWFKCRNNHPYVIGECGGAMQRSTCFCGAPIGGENHALDSSNQHAPEVDGSQHPAWSQAAHNQIMAQAGFRF